MKKHYLKIIYGILLIVFSILSFLLVLLIVEDALYLDIIILCCLILITLIFAHLLVLEFIGHKKCHCDESNMMIKRKDKVLEVFYREHIDNLVKIVDIVTNELDLIIFKYKGKRKMIRITNENKDGINLFLKEMPATIKKNYLYYIVAIFIHG